MGTFLAVRAAGSGVMNAGQVLRPLEEQQRIDDLFGQPVRAEPLRVLQGIHWLSFLSYLY